MSDLQKLCPGCFAAESDAVCTACGYDRSDTAFPTALRPGTLLAGRYLVGRVLGKPGGFGVTYLVFDTNLERSLAMKELMPRDLLARRPDGSTLAPHTEDDRPFFAYTLAAFLGEARTLAKFSHPNVVRIHDYFEANGTAYFTMEYYEGDALSSYLTRQGGKLSGERALALMQPILDALKDIHELGVLHRDIKPSNVYLTTKGTPILLDFGSARQALGERTRTLTTVLTPGYAPFEQYHEKGKQGPWTDVYGCAATLYAMVTGTPPLDAPSRMAGTELVPPSRVAPVSDTLSDAIVAGLSLQPEERPQTIEAFRAMLTGTPPIHGDTTHVWVPGAGSTPVGATLPYPHAQAPRSAEPAPTGAGDAPVHPGGGESLAPTGTAPGPAGDALPVEPSGAAHPAFPAAGDTSGPGPTTPKKSRIPVAALLAVAALMVAGAFGVSQLTQDEAGSMLPEADTIAAPLEATVDDTTGNVPGNQAAQVLSEENPPAQLDTDADAVAEAAPPPTEAQPQTTSESTVVASEPALPVAAPAPKVLVVVFGDGAIARQAETTLQRSLSRATGMEAVDPRGLEVARADRGAIQAALAGDFGALASLGEDFGAEYLLVGDLSAAAVPSVGDFYTGSATLDINVYRASTGGLVDGQAFRVGSGSVPGKLGQNEMDARSQAVDEVSQFAARAARTWVQRLR